MKIIQQKSILVFRSAALGDFILACPALSMLRRVFPGVNIVLLTIQSVHRSQREKVARYAGGQTSFPWLKLATPHLVDSYVVLGDVFDLREIWRAKKELSEYEFQKAILLMDPATPWRARLKKIALLWVLAGFVSVIGWRWKGSLNSNKERLHRSGLLAHHVHGPLHFLSELSPL